MSARVISVLVDGVELLVETVDVVQTGSEPTSRLDDAVEKTADAFDRAQDAVVAMASTVASTTRRLLAKGLDPDRLEVEFGVKFSAQGSVVVATASTEATLRILLSYSTPDRSGDAGSGD